MTTHSFALQNIVSRPAASSSPVSATPAPSSPTTTTTTSPTTSPTTASPITISPATTSATTVSTCSVTPTTPSSPTNVSPVTPTTQAPPIPSSQIGRLKSTFSYWLKPFLALLIYAITLYVALAASTRHTLLGVASPVLGNWLLVLLAKAGDISFAFAVEDTFDTLTWRKLKQRQEVNGTETFMGIRLYWFLALLSSTGIEGLIKILLKSWRKKSAKRTASKWSLIRLAFIVVLIPGPGIVLMARVPQKDVFFPVRTMDVSGGLATYDPRISAFSAVWKPEISKLVLMTLRDSSISYAIDPVSKACKDSDTCKSYLIAGPYNTVRPWPFTVEEDDMDGFRLYDAPFYQVELWNNEPSLTFSRKEDCTLYGGFDPYYEYSMIMCIAEQNSDGLLAAGWKACQLGYSSNGTCLEPLAAGGKAGWSTYLQFYRRKATVTFSRSEFTILDVTSLSPAIPQQIPAASLFQSINSILYQPNLTSNDFRYDRNSQQYDLTQDIGSNLWYTLQPRAQAMPYAREWLRNLLVLPVYIFQPTVLFVDSQASYDVTGNDLQPNLPAENYIKGSYCIVDTRAIPDWKTVAAYAALAAMLLLFVFIGKFVAWFWPEIETSDFPMLDFTVLARLVNENADPVVFRERFVGKQYGGGKVLDEAADLRIGLI